ncbi:quinol:cytochrome c oxidoreductase iron-sulfur protein precursor [Candidatus Koribacter versatilis Ellin345]|uniref:Quinol:cytochrome c oxidoreductase iron-sulfur protein n=2 Tax=Candidatus Korobacter versatilis TaxID=658062 RepID=Q1IM96_KORVE|nr:quinol:cytochrome c oxidoreductase iron-sulfur protein precursor [Candidatus Koribacter versatilis Ellin345]
MDNGSKKNGADVCPSKKGKLELADVKQQLAAAKDGPQYWRSLDELSNTDEFQEMLHREFPRQASEWVDDGGSSRRDFLKLMSASLALAGLTACTKQPIEPIVPYVRQPEELTLGKPLFFATANTVGGYAVPVLAESHEGRPTKLEGNPQHPATLGGTDVFTQASVLTMYDPDRSQVVMLDNEIRTWGSFVGAVANPLAAQKAVQGAGLRLLTRSTTSPTLGAQIKQLLQTYPQAKLVQYDPAGRDNARAGSQLAFGQYVETQYNLDKADIILSLDGDFLSSGFPGFHKYARNFSQRRQPDLKEKMVRFYMAESTPTNTGGKADHRIPMRASDVEQFGRAIAAGIGVAGAGGSAKQEWQNQVAAIVSDLNKHKGAAVVVVGEHQPPAVHALAHSMNAALGAVGTTVTYTEPIEQIPADQTAGLKELVADMNSGKVDLLVVMGANPVYEAPADLAFLDAFKKVAVRIHHGLYVDETAVLSHWHINGTHFLEQWGDVRAFDGTVTIQQPLIAPLYNGKSQYEFVAALNGQGSTSGYELVKGTWQKQHTGADFEAWWRKAVHDGLIAGTAAPAKTVSAKGAPAATNAASDSAMELIFRRDPMIYDGEYSNNGWLQEAPKPITQLTWDNPIEMNVTQAEQMGIKTEDELEITVDGRKIVGGAWLTPGHPKNSVTVFLGYGRTRAGRVGTGTGYNAYQARTSDKQWIVNGVQIAKTGKKFLFATTQGWQNMDGRDLVRVATLEDFIANPEFAHEKTEAPVEGLTIFQPYDYSEKPGETRYKWGMAIDLNSCIGCKSCVVACVSENNIPVVGKELVKRGRHMHWLRVDNYHEGSPDDPKTYYQPVPCQQCENAPCELVCPVGATVHSSEGLNDMVYNRCVGTRYCSNNCPYKVRRFNFLLYQDWETPQYKMMRNPDVSVRSRGVMEKCNYCVQRITHARINSERDGRRIADGEFTTACAQACPASAITFGDLNDPNSQVAKLRAQQRNYGLLEDLNNRPRTTYMAVVRNPNPELEHAMERK